MERFDIDIPDFTFSARQKVIDVHKQILSIIQTHENTYGIPTAVYDIDDTLIDSYGYPIIPVLNTYHYAVKKNVIPFIVTARSEEHRTQTLEQLAAVGIKKIAGLYMTPLKEIPFFNPYTTKMEARKDIASRGFNVLYSVGDKPWDVGDYGGIGFIV